MGRYMGTLQEATGELKLWGAKFGTTLQYACHSWLSTENIFLEAVPLLSPTSASLEVCLEEYRSFIVTAALIMQGALLKMFQNLLLVMKFIKISKSFVIRISYN